MPTQLAFYSLFVAISVWLSAGLTNIGTTGADTHAFRYSDSRDAQNHRLAAAAQNDSQGEPLEPGKTIERDLAGGESHSYLVTLASGQFLHVIIAQRQTDLMATLFGPDGRQVGQFDSRWYGLEPVYFVAEASGSYRLAIQSLHPSATSGAYQLRIEALRAPTPQDQTRVAALKAMTEGKRLIGQGVAQSFRLAKERYEGALPQCREIGDRHAEAQALNSLGFLVGLLIAPAKAIEYYNQALTIRQEVGDRDGEAETLHGIAAMNSALGGKEQALEYYNRALALRRASANRVAEGTTLGNICQIYFSLGQMQKAQECYQQLLPLWRDAGRRDGEAVALIGLGSTHGLTGAAQESHDYLHQALSISRGINDRRGEAAALHNLGKLYAGLGENDKALDVFTQALALFRAAGDRNGEANTLNNLGALEASSGVRQKALDFFNQALVICRAGGDRYGEVYALIGLGKLHVESDEKPKAFDYYEQALALSRKVKNLRGEAIALNGLGLLYAFSEEGRKALDHYYQALPLWRELGDRSGEAATLANLARVERDLGNLTGARRRIEAALTIMETARVKIADQQLRASYFATTQQHHEFYIGLLMRLHRLQPSDGHDVSAFGASERARARGLLEMLGEARADINEGIDASLLERERLLQKKINASAEYQYRLFGDRSTREQLEAVKRELDSLIDELRQVEAEVRKTSPRYAELKYPQPLGLPEIQRMLDSDTLVLEYWLGEDRSYLWAVTPTGVESFELPKRSEIEALARQSYEWLAAEETGAQLRARLVKRAAPTPEWATALSRILLGPVAARLGNKRLVIVADGALQYLPFAALPAPESERQEDKKTRRQRKSAIRNPQSAIR